MKIDSSILNQLPREECDRFECKVTEIVCESFIFTGDRDYLTARFAFFQKQSHLFLWSAAQALEKYVKANILLLGQGAITKTHRHKELADSLREVHPERLNIELSMPKSWAEQGVDSWPDLDVDGFLLRIEKLGAPDVRYDQAQLEVHLQDLVLLDRLAFRLRHQLIIEDVVGCSLVGEPLKQCFFDLNYSFAPKNHQHPKLIGLRLFHTSVTTLEAAIKGVYGNAEVYRDWAKQSLRLNPEHVRRLSDRSNADL